MTTTQDKKLKLLNKTFGHKEFRPGQEEIVDTVIDYKHYRGVLAVMPTGGGKSLLYQLPSLIFDGLTIVVSPLISLMKDQVDAMNKQGIGAAFWNSSQTKNEQITILNSLNLGLIDILYVSPERFSNDAFMEMITDYEIDLMAIDEAHSISQWGHDFRPAYRRLKHAINLLKPKQVLAVTATATKIVQEDICSQLGMSFAKKFIKGFYRPNLEIQVHNAESPTYLIVEDIREQLKLNNTTGIVYAATTLYAEELFEYLTEIEEIDCYIYHGKMSQDKRTEIQSSWSNRGGIMIATCAFGMGIDRSDVRFIIHSQMPGSIEAWYQEIGRAGRDGLKSLCKTYISKKGVMLHKFLLNLSMPPRAEIEKFIKFAYYQTDPNNRDIKMAQTKMAELSKCKFVSGAISVLKKAGIMSKVKNGHYVLDKRPDRWYKLTEMIDWNSHNESRNRRNSQIDQTYAMFCNLKECRNKQILAYFGDNSMQKDCRTCDYCVKKYT